MMEKQKDVLNAITLGKNLYIIYYYFKVNTVRKMKIEKNALVVKKQNIEN